MNPQTFMEAIEGKWALHEQYRSEKVGDLLSITVQPLESNAGPMLDLEFCQLLSLAQVRAVDDAAGVRDDQRAKRTAHDVVEKVPLAALPEAAPYFVSREITDALAGAYDGYPADSVKLREGFLPTPAGFIWYEPERGVKLRTTSPSGFDYRVKAVLWQQASPRSDPPAASETGSASVPDHDAAFLWVYGYSSNGDEDPTDFRWMDLLVPVLLTSYGSALFLPETKRMFKALFPDGLDAADTITINWPQGGEMRSTSIAASEYRAFVQSLVEEAQRLVLSTLTFLGQTIVQTSRWRQTRPTSRRAPKFDEGTEVRVIELRRKRYVGGPEPEGEGREFSCRWIVRGHWHNYWVGPADDRRLEPRWLSPYVKGPDDKPLRRTTDLFAVTR